MNGHLTCLDISDRWLNACRRTMRSYKNVTFLHAEATVLPEDSFDIIYCHFVLHDISASDLKTVIPALVKSLKSGGSLIFREQLSEVKKLIIIKLLLDNGGMSRKDSRITDIPMMGNALECIYIKQ
mgnify:FL=1